MTGRSLIVPDGTVLLSYGLTPTATAITLGAISPVVRLSATGPSRPTATSLSYFCNSAPVSVHTGGPAASRINASDASPDAAGHVITAGPRRGRHGPRAPIAAVLRRVLDSAKSIASHRGEHYPTGV